MSHDLRGTQNTSSSIPLSNELPEFYHNYKKTIQGTTLDLHVYDGTDTMGHLQGNFIPQQFKIKDSTVYDTSAQQPELMYADSEGDNVYQPMGIAEQRLVMRFFYQRIKKLIHQSDLSETDAKLVYQAITTQNSLPNTQLNKLAQIINEQATKETQQEASLPKNWNAQSTQILDWVQEPIQPYNEEKQKEILQYYDQAIQKYFSKYASENSLNNDQIEKLNSAIATGKVSVDVAEIFHIITQQATQETQKIYGLSETWYKSLPIQSDDWKPIYLSSFNPRIINQERGEVLIENIDTLLTNYQKAGDDLEDFFNSFNQDTMDMVSYRRIVTKAIEDLKNILKEIQVSSSEQSSQAFKAKMDAITAKSDQYDIEKANRDEILAKQERAEKISSIMKIVGPSIAALSTVIGAALLIFTAGASTALIVAGIAVGTAMTAYSIVDSTTGATQKLMSVINDSLKEAFPDNPLVQKIVKTVGVVVIAAILAIMIALTAGGAAANIASSTAVQVAKEIVKQLSIQLLIMSIMASNALPELAGEILKSQGVDESTNQIVEMIVMAITLLTVMLAMAVGSKGSFSIKGVIDDIVEGAKLAARNVQQLANRAIAIAKQIVDEIKQGVTQAIQTLLKSLQKLLHQMLSGLSQLGQAVKELPQQIGNALNTTIQRTKDTIEALMAFIKDPIKRKEMLEALLENFQKASQKLLDDLQNLGLEIKNLIIKGKDQAMDAFNAACQKLVELLTVALNKLAEAAKDSGHYIIDTGRGFKETFAGFARVFTQKDPFQGLIAAQKLTQLTQHSINTITGINQGILALQVAKLLEEVGQTKEAQEIIQAAMKMIEKLLSALQASMDNDSDFLQSLQRAFNSFYDNLNRNTTKLFQALQG